MGYTPAPGEAHLDTQRAIDEVEEAMSQAVMPPPAGVVADLQNPTDVIRTINLITQGLTIGICTFFFAIRGVQKLRTPTLHLAVDDYLTLISWVLLLGYCISGILLSMHGGGYHLWEVDTVSFIRYMKAMYSATIFYALMTLFIKLSLLSLIARVFAPYRNKVLGIYALGGLLTIYYIIGLILKIRICAPISAYWHGHTEKCLNQSALITADSIISTVTDTIILLLPLPLTWSLQIPQKKKIRVGLMLAVGGLATAFSAWRLHLILTDGDSPDYTILFVQVVLSGNAEAGIALICCCLPAAVGQFKFLRDRAYGSSRSAERGETASSGSRLKSFASRRGLVKSKNANGTQTATDEVELVPHAQGNSVSISGEKNTAQPDGIMRKVEVTHAVSYATDGDSDGISRSESKAESR